MAKYNELVKKYAEEIARIKLLKEKEQEAKEKLNKYEPSEGDWDNYDYAAHAELDHAWEEAHQSLSIEYEKLSQDIEAEYWDVPFVKARKQGIEKFFETAGI